MKVLAFAVVFALIPLGAQAQAVGPELSSNRTAIDFGRWNPVNDIVPGSGFHLASSGTSDVTITKVALTGPNADDFSLSSGPGCEGIFAPGSGCYMSVWFDYHGATAGEKVAAIEVTSDDPDNPLVILVTGEVEITRATISPSMHDFGTVEVGSPEPLPTKTFQVTSVGSRPFDLRAAYLMFDDKDSFRITGSTCPATINPGQACGVTVEFNPTAGAFGVRTTTLNIPHGLTPAYTVLSGTATPRFVIPEPHPSIPPSPRVQKTKRGVLKVLKGGGVTFVQLTCPKVACRVTAASAVVHVRGHRYRASLKVTRDRLSPDEIVTARVKLPRRAVKRLRAGVRSGSARVTIRVASEDKRVEPIKKTMRIGLEG
ncbi:MAG: choice-of-anchor D domain-containing protein [Solirubrobacterales bacterium]